VLVDGKYIPSVNELIKIFKKTDLIGIFNDSRLIEEENNFLTISFNSLELSHLFVLLLDANGFENGLFYPSISEGFFTETLLEDHRIDGNQLTYFEEIYNSKVTARLSIKYPYEEEHSDKLTTMVINTVKQAMPHLAEEVKDFKL
jgi:hypothetical protein